MKTIFLLTVLALVASFAACSGDDEGTLVVPTATITPRDRPSVTNTPGSATSTETATETATSTSEGTSTPTPVEDALPGEILEQFLTFWRDARYSDMYDLLSTTAMDRISRVDFVKRYREIAEAAGITSVTGLLSTADRAASLQSYSVTISTHLFGDIKEKNVANFVQEDRWRVDWTPALIFKDLSGPNLIHLFALEPDRGAILDRSGEPLAITVSVAEVGISNGSIGDEATTVQYLADRLGMTADEIYAKIHVDVPDYYFIPLKTLPYDVDPALLAELRSNANVIINETTMRVYPHGSMASHVLGYMSIISAEEYEELKSEGYTAQDLIGKAGIEGIYERDLAGSRGARLAVISPEGASASTAHLTFRPAKEPG